MRNLVLRERRLLQLAPVDLAGQTLFHCVNEEAGCVYCLGENLVLFAHRLSDGKVRLVLSQRQAWGCKTMLHADAWHAALSRCI